MSEMVERVARALYAAEYDQDAYPWDRLTESEKQEYSRMARAAIEELRRVLNEMIDAALQPDGEESRRADLLPVPQKG